MNLLVKRRLNFVKFAPAILIRDPISRSGIPLLNGVNVVPRYLKDLVFFSSMLSSPQIESGYVSSSWCPKMMVSVLDLFMIKFCDTVSLVPPWLFAGHFAIRILPRMRSPSTVYISPFSFCCRFLSLAAFECIRNLNLKEMSSFLHRSANILMT